MAAFERDYMKSPEALIRTTAGHRSSTQSGSSRIAVLLVGLTMLTTVCAITVWWL